MVARRSEYIYEDSALCSITTFTGLRIGITMSDGQLWELEDVLVRVNQNGRGITRYVYDEKGRITEITDQNNKRYTVNTFDSRGRVTGQDYPDGTRCEISYDDKEGSATFYYPETGGRQTAFHNADGGMQEPEGAGFFPVRETSPVGNGYTYAYDRAGRKTHAKTADGSMRFSYNSLNHVNCVTDGERNGTHDECDNLGSLIRHHNARQWERDRSGGYAYEYDYLDRLVRVKNPAGRVKTFRRNGQGSIVYESLLSLPAQVPENDTAHGIRSVYDASYKKNQVR